jgi:hypothetical protein
MRRGTIGALVVATALGAGSVAASAAGGDGLPVTATASPKTGIESADGAERYVALGAGRNGTTVARISRATGEVQQWRYLPEFLTVPGVAFDGSVTGLSADNETLVLSSPFALGQRKTELTVLDAQRLRVQDRITLRGSFAVDAISPDGGQLYLIEYLSPRNPTQYSVRAFDLDRGRLLPDPILDPDESGDEMYGTPMTREMSPDGRWAYTLYDGRSEDFIHALDTERGTAVCIDLDELQTRVWNLDMQRSADGGALELTKRGETEAVVDTKTFEVAYPTADGATGEPSDGSDGVHAWLLAVGAAVLAAIVGAFAFRRRRAAPAG